MSKTRKSASSSQDPAKTASTRANSRGGNPPSNARQSRSQNTPAQQQAIATAYAPIIRDSLAITHLGEDWGAPQEGEPEEKLTPQTTRRLPSNVKAFIVIHNACGASPSAVVKAVKEVFDLDVTPNRIEKFDPTKVSGQSMSMELKGLFRQAQREYQQMVVRVGIADQRWRLTKLHNIAQFAYDRGNYKLCMEAMEQVSKEVGGVYTNKSMIQVDDKRQLLAQLLQCSPDQLPAMKAAVDAAKNKDKVH